MEEDHIKRLRVEAREDHYTNHVFLDLRAYWTALWEGGETEPWRPVLTKQPVRGPGRGRGTRAKKLIV